MNAKGSRLKLETMVSSFVTDVTVGFGTLQETGTIVTRSLRGAPASQALVVTDANVAPMYLERVVNSFVAAGIPAEPVVLQPGENSKSRESVELLYNELAARRIDRDGILLALGGGVVSDVSGFAAATWLRGIRFVICPTTLGAALDASIGGKTGVNMPQGKNLVGAFHLPCAVIVDPKCLQTLPPRELRAGLAESVKHALIDSTSFFSWHEENIDAILSLEPTVLTKLILENIRVKAAIVAEDARETGGRRVLLNLGHTIGHAIERCSDYKMRHGECVALGLIAACRISVQRKMLNQETVDRVVRVLESLGLPTHLADPLPTSRILETVRFDKKSKGGVVRFVLLSGIGTAEVCSDVTEDHIAKAFESLLV